MPNYSLGKIYKIEPICEHADGEVYIGSTIQTLSRRLTNHHARYKRFEDGKCNRITAFELFEKYGIESCKITLLETVNSNTKTELLAREQFYIQSIKCVNKYIPLRTIKEWYQDNKEKVKEYRESNKEKIREYLSKYRKDNKEILKEYREINKDKTKERDREYYQENREKIKCRAKEYRVNNKDKIKEVRKEYYQENKDAILQRKSQKIQCECGSDIRKGDISTHKKSIKHQNYEKSKQTEPDPEQ